MNNYQPIRSQLIKIVSELEERQQAIRKYEEWLDDSLNNCVQKEEIENQLVEIQDKLKKAVSEVEDAMSCLRR